MARATEPMIHSDEPVPAHKHAEAIVVLRPMRADHRVGGSRWTNLDTISSKFIAGSAALAEPPGDAARGLGPPPPGDAARGLGPAPPPGDAARGQGPAPSSSSAKQSHDASPPELFELIAIASSSALDVVSAKSASLLVVDMMSAATDMAPWPAGSRQRIEPALL